MNPPKSCVRLKGEGQCFKSFRNPLATLSVGAPKQLSDCWTCIWHIMTVLFCILFAIYIRACKQYKQVRSDYIQWILILYDPHISLCQTRGQRLKAPRKAPRSLANISDTSVIILEVMCFTFFNMCCMMFHEKKTLKRKYRFHSVCLFRRKLQRKRRSHQRRKRWQAPKSQQPRPKRPRPTKSKLRTGKSLESMDSCDSFHRFFTFDTCIIHVYYRNYIYIIHISSGIYIYIYIDIPK